jgi:hypothetical protein
MEWFTGVSLTGIVTGLLKAIDASEKFTQDLLHDFNLQRYASQKRESSILKALVDTDPDDPALRDEHPQTKDE